MRPMPLLLALLLLAPLAAAQPQPAPPAEFPPALLALLPRWLDEAEAAGRGPDGAPVSPGADAYLARAREAAAEGRFRVALFHLDTHRQLLDAQRLLDAAGAGAGAERTERVLALAEAWRRQALDDWDAYRQALRAYDGVKSLQAAELALYSADLALVAAVQTVSARDAMDALRASGRVDDAHAAALARATRGVSHQLVLARDLLDAAGALEGLPPRLDADAWSRALAQAAAPVDPDALAPYLRPLEEVAGSSRARDERLLALALHLAQVRDARVAAIQQQFGDAAARGLDAVRDAALGLRRGAENLSLDAHRADGLLGVFAADALDRARYTVSLAENGTLGLGPVSFSWAALDHQARVHAVLAQARPPPAEKAETPAPGPLAALALAALLLTRRRA